MSGDTPPATGITPRFSLLIEQMIRGLFAGASRRQLRGPLGELGPLIGVLWHYLMHTRRRLTALYAHFAAGKLPAAPRRSTTARPAGEQAKAQRRPPAMPRGPLFLPYDLGAFIYPLRELLDDPEMRALLAASPQAGRLLRPLWRKLTVDPLPEMLRRPPMPRRAKQPRPERPAVVRAKAAPAAPEATGRAAWRYPVSLWADPAPSAKPAPPLPPWPPPFSQV